jgi:hypothetical protein
VPYVNASVHVHEVVSGSTYYWQLSVWTDGDDDEDFDGTLVYSHLSSGFTLPNGSTTTNCDGSTESDVTITQEVIGLISGSPYLSSGDYTARLTLMQVDSDFTSGYSLNTAAALASFSCWWDDFDITVP